MKTAKKWVSFGVVGLFLVLFVWNPLWMLEYRLQDSVYQRPGIPYPNIIVIGIDERALYEFHQWPFSRHVWADAVNFLNTYEDARPAVIALDILFTEPGWDPYADAALVEAVAQGGNVVLASLVDTGFDVYNLTLDIVLTEYLQSFPGLRPHGTHGVVNGMRDRDGIVRNAPLRLAFGGQMLYTFPLAAAMMYTGLDAHQLIGSAAPDGHHYTAIRYTGMPGEFIWFSVSDLFDGSIDPIMFAGAIVLIGPAALGMTDSYPVPITHADPMHGVEIHANVLQMILEGDFKQRLPDALNVLLLLVILTAAMLSGEFLNIRYNLILFLAMGTGYIFGARFIYQQGLILPLLGPLLTLAVIFLYQLAYGYILEIIEKARMRSTFKKYVDPGLVDKLIESKEADGDEVGRKKHIAVLFVDVRGFTPMTEALQDTPELMVEILNSYLDLTASSIFNNGGSVDKFIGDATMGLFNGFVPLDDYVYKAALAAWDMVTGAEALNIRIKEKTGIDLGFGIGIHCGDAIVGNLGPSFRKDYTAIGDVVNTASRLESNAGRSQVLISREVYNMVKDRMDTQFLGEITLKGKKEPMETFCITGLKTKEQKNIPRLKETTTTAF